MSSRPSFGYPPGRGSPYGSMLDHGRGISDLVEYIDSNHEVMQDYRHPSIAVADDHMMQDDPNAPDVVHVEYKRNRFRVDFPAYAISEEKTTVKHLRRKVAEHLDVEDPSRICLTYKKKELRRDDWALKKYHMKQNSVVMAVLMEMASYYEGHESDAESANDSGSSGHQNARRRPRGKSMHRQRSDEFPMHTTTGAAFLHPDHHNRHHTRKGSSGGRRQSKVAEADQSYRNNQRPSDMAEPSRPSPPHQRSPPDSSRSPSPDINSIPPADPSTPLGKIQVLSNMFFSKWVIESNAFIRAPPPDKTARNKEYHRLNESIMSQILLKADEIDAEGDARVRAVRKPLILQAQALQKKLDAVQK